VVRGCFVFLMFPLFVGRAVGLEGCAASRACVLASRFSPGTDPVVAAPAQLHAQVPVPKLKRRHNESSRRASTLSPCNPPRIHILEQIGVVAALAQLHAQVHELVKVRVEQVY